MTIRLDRLNPLQLDALKELGNIGAGNSATALSQIISKKIDMSVPRVKVYSIYEIPELFGGSENIVVGVLLRMFGDMQGSLMFLLDEESARKLLSDMMLGQEVGNLTDELPMSAMMEVGNIISSSYLNALSFFSNLTIIPSTPAFAYDMAGAILGTILYEVSELSDQVLLIETDFLGNGEAIRGHFFVLPDLPSLGILLKAVGVE
ncbi:MAG: chemotaxis protein CheC [Fusobacteriaceae bacterium]|jgi:chemotaxis protein CheC|nr:chemotaxis protein CheC [Fusobacteriaceae bacterium]MBP6466488.1 chemotaxis protein CheC [Fusobacteriaceae bacterium]MBP9595315.1 chemotaxis protein CheC [Fusobacteriaceae bacterium]MBU9916912.1 chemotaxis protein CheC [Fusobacteriaceae bacterium]